MNLYFATLIVFVGGLIFIVGREDCKIEIQVYDKVCKNLLQFLSEKRYDKICKKAQVWVWERIDQIYPQISQYYRSDNPIESYWHSNDIYIYSAQSLNNKR